MSSYSLPFRKEVQEFSRSCEHLLFSGNTVSFTTEELGLMVYYASLLTKLAEGNTIDATEIHSGRGTHSPPR